MESEFKEEDNGSEPESENVKAKKNSSKSKKSRSKKEPKQSSSSYKEQQEMIAPSRQWGEASKRDAMKSDTGNGITLWDLALQQTREKETTEKQVDEKSIILLGSKDSGKTSIILRFLDRDEPPKPTTALEYTFGRRAKTNNLDKDVANIWELGGGTWLSSLVDVTIDGDSIKNMSVALVLDLSKPNEMWLTLDKWLKVLKERVEIIIRDADHTMREHLKEDAWEQIGAEHVDRDSNLIDPFLLPLVIIGAKYDVFQDFDPDKRKMICKTLRFVAHKHGAHLIFCSTKQEALFSKTKSVINHFVFATALQKLSQFEHDKPIMITAGQDTFEQIGSPPLPEGDIGRVTAKSPWDLWKNAYIHHFPQENLADPSLVADPAKDKQFAECVVDAMRIKKNEELEIYRNQAERRARAALHKSPLEVSA